MGSPTPFTVYRFHAPESSSDENTSDARAKEEDAIPTYRIQNANVTKTEQGFMLTMDLPGIKPEDVTVSLNHSDVKVVATRKQNAKVVKQYQREFTIDKKAINSGEITSALEDGVLTITFPKKPAAEPIELELLTMDPPASDNDDTFRFDLELPGVKKADLKVSLKDDTLSIHAHRKVGSSSSVLKRRFTVPDEIEIEKVSAYLMDGILTVLAPKKEPATAEPTGRLIPINEAPEAKPVAETIEADAVKNEEEEEDTVMIGHDEE